MVIRSAIPFQYAVYMKARFLRVFHGKNRIFVHDVVQQPFSIQFSFILKKRRGVEGWSKHSTRIAGTYMLFNTHEATQLRPSLL